MSDSLRSGLADRELDQAITALKKGAHLLKYGRYGKPKFCPFHLSNDESALIWYSGKREKQIKLSQVLRVLPGQRTAIFQRYPRPEKEYQSFSLICSDRSLDLICKDKEEAEVWFGGLKALVSRGYARKWRNEAKRDSASSESPNARPRPISPFFPLFDTGDAHGIQPPSENVQNNKWGKVFADIVTLTAPTNSSHQAEAVASSLSSLSASCAENSSARISTSEAARVSLSSVVSASSHDGSCHEDFDAINDVFIWGEGISDGLLGSSLHRIEYSNSTNLGSFLPKVLASSVVLDVNYISCGSRHAVLVTKQGEIYSWGEESGGRLGHGVDADVPHPKLIDNLRSMNIDLVASGEFHTCAVTVSGDLYTWGDGTHNSGMLGHGSESSHWIPKKVSGPIEGVYVSYVSCGPWHTAALTSTGQLFTFGDGSFGALGHGDCSSTNIPREVEDLRGLRTTRVACGVWHTAAVVEVTIDSSTPESGSSTGRLFTWGDGGKGRLGHGDKEPRLVPKRVHRLSDENISRVACGHDLTVALTSNGQVYTTGSAAYGQLGSPTADGKLPSHVASNIADSIVDDIACGAHHVAVLTSRGQVYTWGKGVNGQLGHGDTENKNTPTLVDVLKDKQVKNIACGSNFTAIICLHKWVSSADHSFCSGCRNLFGFRRKRHNCYNCGLVFCKTCSSRKSLKAALAPNTNKPYRVCDGCFTKLKKSTESSQSGTPVARYSNANHRSDYTSDRENLVPRSPSPLSKVRSADSIYQTDGKHFKSDSTSIRGRGENGKLEVNDSYIFPSINGKLQPGGSYSSNAPVFQAEGSKNLSVTIPGPKTSPVPLSPVSFKSSPPRSSGGTIEDAKYMNGSLSQEVISLTTQVEDLTRKSNYLEGKLEKTTRKYKSAKEVIKSLTAQLKEMAGRQAEKDTAGSNSNFTSKNTFRVWVEPQTKNMETLDSEPTTKPENATLAHGSKPETEKAEQIIQFEPGVYITLVSLPGGTNELKRVRFSRKHFKEEEAEKWWAENEARVCERHNVQPSK